jgi:outer membrane protein
MQSAKPFANSVTHQLHVLRKRAVFLALGLASALAATSLTLETTLTALPKSLEWQAVDLQFQSAQRSYESAQAAVGVRLNVGGDSSATFNTTAGTSSLTYKLNASLSVPVLPWAAQFDDLRKAERTYARAVLDRRDSRNTLAVNVASQYQSLRLAQLDLALAQKTTALRETQASIAQNQRSNNQITADQLASSVQNLETAKQNLLQAEATLELAQLTLSNTLDMPDLPTASTAVGLVNLPSQAFELLLKTALKDRTDMQKAVYAVRDAEDNLAIAQRDRWLPSASLNVGVSDSGANLNSSLNLQTGQLSVGASYQPPTGNSSGTVITLGASISLPVLAPSNDSRIASSETALKAAKQAVERTQKSAELDVRAKYLDAQTAWRRIALSQKALENAKNVLSTTQARVAAGAQTKTDLESSLLGVQQAERDLENVVGAAHVALLRLETALGKGLVK